MNSVFKPVEIKAYTDILNAVSRFKSDYVDRCSISSELVWGVQSENGSIREEKATISIKDKSVTMRQLLVDGFDQVKEQEKLFNSMRDALNEDEFAPTLPAMDIDHFNMPVDKLIKIRLGGKRKGYKVMWDLNNKVYELDPYTCELKEIS
jgi:hypothetical protein